jgi:hypothetical protein
MSPAKEAWTMKQRHQLMPNKKDAKISSAVYLTKTVKSGDVRLDDKELNWVSGGVVVEKIGPDLGLHVDDIHKSKADA